MVVATAIPLIVMGCTSVNVRMSDGTWPMAGSTTLVLPLDETAATASASDYTFFGSIGAQGSGVAVARALAQALEHALDTVQPDRDAVERYILAQKMKPSELGKLDRDSAMAMARALRSDTLVTGTVRECGSRWALFLPVARLSFEVTAFDSATGAELWHGEYRARSLRRSEWDLVREGTSAIAARLVRGRTSGR